jgi:hypothetical protein
MRRLIVVVAMLVLGAAAATAAPASASDGSPCGPGVGYNGWWVQYCPDWSPNNSIPVHRDPSARSPTVGSIYAPGDDWYVCQKRVPGSVYALGRYRSDVWAWTLSDNGRWGWVSEVYFRGGGNFDADARLRACL